MKIFVCIKQVPDTETKIRLNADNSNIDPAGVKWVMNPYDEFAVEEALKLHQEFNLPVWCGISRWSTCKVIVPDDVQAVRLILRGAR